MPVAAKPDFDSDWTSLYKGDNPFRHNLNTMDLFVYVMGRKTLEGAVHQISYGGDKSGFNFDGVYWHKLTKTEVTVHRHGQDSNWKYVRVLMWRIPKT